MMMTLLYFSTTGSLHPKQHKAYQMLVFCLVLASKIPWTEEPSRLQSIGPQRVGHDWMTITFTFHFHALEKEMANPLQCSCLENPRDGGAWWSSIYGVTQSRTQLMRLSSTVLLFKVLNLE